MIPNDEMLMAYADGELDASQRAQVEAAMRADPQLARRVASHRALRERLQGSFKAVLREPVPERLSAAARAHPASFGSAQVVQLRARKVGPGRLAWWGSMAASFLLGATGWYFAGGGLSADPLVERDGQLLASGRLERALSTQLASVETQQQPVRIGTSFRNHQGSYCRTFELQGAQSLAGLACREHQRWQVNTLARAQSAPSAGYRQAASSWPPAVLQAVDESIAGEPLDAQAESQARARGWQ
jgi:anti-sigma factor RsiW